MSGDLTQRIAAEQGIDDETAAAIWDAYFGKLVDYARRKMASLPRRAVDEEDVALSALNSFFNGVNEGRFSPKGNDELWKLLATITVRKATAQQRKHFTQKRGGGAIRGESVFLNRRQSDKEGGFGLEQVLDDKNIPGLSVQLMRTVEEMLGQLEGDDLRQVALLRLEGHTTAEIACKLDRSTATIKRRLQRIREIWS